VHFLCREYVRFELLYVEKLKARQSLLEGKKQTEEGTDKQREELVEDSEAVDNVLNCSIVKLALEVSMAEGGAGRGFRGCGQCPQLFHHQAGSRGQYGREGGTGRGFRGCVQCPQLFHRQKCFFKIHIQKFKMK
jgi:hypothetical protein